MKKTIKTIAISLSILMLLLSMPLTAFADGTNASEPELIFAVDNLLDENKIDNEYEFQDAPYSPGTAENYKGTGKQLPMDPNKPDVVVRSSDLTQTNELANQSTARQTNIPADSGKYTLTFSGQIGDYSWIEQYGDVNNQRYAISSAAWMFSGVPGGKNNIGWGKSVNVLINENQYKCNIGKNKEYWPTGTHNGTGFTLTTAEGAGPFHTATMRDYVIVFDNGNFTVYISDNNGSFINCGTYTKPFQADTYFAFGAWINNSFNASVQNADNDFKENVLLANTDVVKMKDIKLYKGNLDMSDKTVEFEGYGDAKTVKHNAVIGEFPTVEASEGNVIKWFYKNTDKVALPTHRVTADTVIEARELTADEVNTFSSVVGLQATKAVDNKTTLRFLSTIDSIAGQQAGFEIVAYYNYNAEAGTYDTQSWTRKTSYVFTQINAEANGTVANVTAEQLGGKYVIALGIENVPTNIGQVDFYARSYVLMPGGEKQYSDWSCFTMSNGDFSLGLAAKVSAPADWVSTPAN